MDILGLLPVIKGQLKFPLVAINYFTKWIDVEPIAKMTTRRVEKFLWKNIICRHGIPHSIFIDNGTQFGDRSFQNICKSLGIKQHLSSIRYPQTNGQAKATNKVTLNGLKRRLREARGSWVEELPSILWAYHVTPQSTINETPFKLTYGADAMIPVEVGEPSEKNKI